MPPTPRQRAASRRAAAARAQRRRRLMTIAGSAVAVLAVIGAIAAIGLTRGSAKSSTGPARTAAPAAVVAQVTGVPTSTLDSVGAGTARSLPQPITETPLTTKGKPEVLYVGAEYCPYCAAERWAMVQALSRFGTFSGLKATHSSSVDVFPNTPTFSFYGSTFTSNYVQFTGREIESNQVQNGRYAPLETLTSAQQQIFSKYSQQEAFPFIDLGGRYVVNGVQYDNSVLQGKSMTQIAASLADPSNPIARAVDGTANTLTAAICKLTNNQPSNVCSDPAVTAIASHLSGK